MNYCISCPEQFTSEDGLFSHFLQFHRMWEDYARNIISKRINIYSILSNHQEPPQTSFNPEPVQFEAKWSASIENSVLSDSDSLNLGGITSSHESELPQFKPEEIKCELPDSENHFPAEGIDGFDSAYRGSPVIGKETTMPPDMIHFAPKGPDISQEATSVASWPQLPKLYTCNRCQVNLTNYIDVQRHLQSTDCQHFTCCKCRVILEQSEILIHMKNCHLSPEFQSNEKDSQNPVEKGSGDSGSGEKIQKKKPSNTSWCNCNHCGATHFKNYKDLRLHLKEMHDGKANFTCSICGRGFINKYTLAGNYYINNMK